MNSRENSAESKVPKITFVLSAAEPESAARSPYVTVAEDIEWLRDQWVNGLPPSPAELRRGSAALRRLLVDGLVNEAWRFHGFHDGPTVFGPDLLGLIKKAGYEVQYTVVAIAGGGNRQNVISAAIGAWRVDNRETGVKAGADVGFGVVTGMVCRHTLGEQTAGEYDVFVEKRWKLGAYLKAAGAIRRGHVISRELIVLYFANYAGGVHLDQVGKRNPAKRAKYELVSELERTSVAMDLNGIFFELLSIGQVLATSPDIRELVAAIRR